MGRGLILETTFLVDLEREVRRARPGPALAFLAAEEDASLYVTFTVAGEMAAGASLEERPAWEEFLSPFRVLPASVDVCWEYGHLYRYLQRNGLLIAGNDLWIAATAVVHGMALVTRNLPHFRRIPRLEVVAYT